MTNDVIAMTSNLEERWDPLKCDMKGDSQV